MSPGAFRALSRAMLKGLLRDRTAVFFTILFPIMFLALFGLLFQDTAGARVTVVEVGDVAVLDDMPQEQLAALSDALTIERSADRAQALEDVRNGDVDAVVWEDDGRVELRISMADAARAGTAQGLMQSIVQTANVAATGQDPAHTLVTDRVEDESVKPIQFLTPGLLGYAVATGAAYSSAFTLVTWRKKRILRRLWLAPVSPGAVVGARVGVSLAVAFVQVAIFIGVAALPVYGLQLSGNWWLTLPLVACGTLAFMSIGLLIGALVGSEEAANGALQSVVLPMAFLAGSFFPTEMMPGWLRAVSNILPLKHLNEAVMDVLTRDGGWGDALPVMGGLLLFTAVLTAIAARFFRWDNA
ncbi:ABC transporter permease [Streptomyces avicenniae]|uniref:ABC transporter permease n=1 Tax=Streptomyces avicenniae TaxID=500153 RepID=UPI00069BD691|nr:ABC transporter permease [Streptomyces avicenniae]